MPQSSAELARRFGGVPTAELAQRYGGRPTLADVPTAVDRAKAAIAEMHVRNRAAGLESPERDRLDAMVREYEGKRRDLDRSAPAVAAMATAPFTGGLPVPAAAAATGGAAGLVSIARDWLSGDDVPMPEALKNASKEALFQAVTQAGGQLLAKAAPGARRLARNWWVRLAKPTEAALKRTQAMLRGGTSAEAAQEVAETALSLGRGTLRPGNVQAMRSGLDALDAKLAAVIQPSRKTVPKAAIERALLDYLNEIDYGTLESSTDVAAVAKVWEGLQRMPAQIPIQRAQALKQHIYRSVPYVAGREDSALSAAEKVAGRELRHQIAAAEPAVAPINEQLSRQIPATKVMEQAVKRAGNTNPIDLTSSIASAAGAAAAGSPHGLTAGALGLVNRPMAASFLAQRLYQLAPLLAAAGLISPQAVRVLQVIASEGDPAQP